MERPAARNVARVRDIVEARQACEAAQAAGRDIELWSPPFGAGQMGPLWFQRMIALVRAEFPDTGIRAVLDCGDAPGHALAALRQGIEAIALDAPERVRRKIAAIAEAGGAELVDRPPGR